MALKDKEKNIKKVPFIFSIRLRIILAFLVPIVCILILGLASYEKAASAITESYKEQTQQTAEVLRQYVTLITESEREDFKSYMAEQTLMYYFKDILDRKDMLSAKSTYNEQFRDKLTRDSKISNIYVLSDNGKSLFGKTATLADDAYSQFAQSLEGQYILENPYDWKLFGYNSELDAATGMNPGYAIRWVRKFKDVPDVLIVDFSESEIREALSILDAGEGGYVALITSDGKEFYSVENATSAQLIFGQSFYDAAVSSENESGNTQVQISGKDYLFVYSKIDDAGTMIAALIPQENVLAQTADIKSLTMIITIIAALISIILALLITGKMSGTIRYILRKLQMVAAGDLTTHLTPKGRDEFALLCSGINETVENVKDLIVGVNAVSAEVEEAAQNMAEASDTFKETSGDIRIAADKIESGAGKLDSNSANCLGQMDTLSTQIKEVGVNAGEIEKLTNQTGATIEDGVKSVDDLTESAKATSRITGDVIASIKELEEKSKAIYEIVSSINGIAKQTNLLSLNAGIEAARAGEAGRGFTVVASEIRVLSTQCMTSANQISEIVDEISTKTSEVVAIAGQASSVVDSQAEAVKHTKASFEKINEQVNTLIEALGVISENVGVMNVSRVQTLESIESISDISNETVACSAEVTQATGTQVEAIDNLDEASILLKEKAEALVEMLASFKIED